jgi:hypothetical protein
MTVILNGNAVLERDILPKLSKAIAGCEKHGETHLKAMLERWKAEAIQFMYGSALPIQSSQVATANVNTVIPTNNSIAEPIDQGLYTITRYYVDNYEMTEEEAAMQAAKDLSEGRTLHDVLNQS